MADQAERRGVEYMEQGEKALKKFSLFSSSGKYEDAIDWFVKAANQFKIAKKWKEAGEAFGRSAECHLKLSSPHEAATAYQDAANCFAKSDPIQAVEYFQRAINMMTEIGRFSNAAKLQKQIAEIYEQEHNFEKAIESYQQAADYYSGENQPSAANNMLLKVAQFSAQLEDYDRATQIFEEVGQACLDSNLLKFNAKGHFLNGGLCHLATKDVVAISQAIERYKDLDYSFADSRECKLLEDLAKACEEYNIDDFTDCVYNYDNISKLDPWKTTILLRIKEGIGAAAEESVDLT